MPAERDSTYPTATASEADNAPGTREEKAARFIVARHINGIPRRAFIVGDNDSAVIVKGVLDLTTACWAVIDAIHAEQNMSAEEFARSQATMNAVDRMEAILCQHGCPDDGPHDG